MAKLKTGRHTSAIKAWRKSEKNASRNRGIKERLRDTTKDFAALAGKKDIEAYGIAEFNERCRGSVLRHVGAFADLTERMGYWVDMGDAYWTMDAHYVESVWWSLKQIFDKGLLVQDHRVAPYCPRCGTGLSDHELAQGYETVIDPSVYVRFPVDPDSALGEQFPGLALLVWTTTPWTLLSNVALAVGENIDYAEVAVGEGEAQVVGLTTDGWYVVEENA